MFTYSDAACPVLKCIYPHVHTSILKYFSTLYYNIGVANSVNVNFSIVSTITTLQHFCNFLFLLSSSRFSLSFLLARLPHNLFHVCLTNTMTQMLQCGFIMPLWIHKTSLKQNVKLFHIEFLMEFFHRLQHFSNPSRHYN